MWCRLMSTLIVGVAGPVQLLRSSTRDSGPTDVDPK